MRNFVAKNDFNRAATHKSARDYTRVSNQELMDAAYEDLDDSWSFPGLPCMEEDWGVSEDLTKPPKKVVSKWANPSRNYFNNKGINMTLSTRFISVLDIESLGTPGDCRSTHIAMPSFAFVLMKDIVSDPYIVFGTVNVQEQLANGAQVSASTIAFWMEEAMKGSSAAKSIIASLRENDMSSVTVCNPTKSGNDVVAHQNFFDNIDAFTEVAVVFDGIIHEQGIDPKSLRHYGNGPQFDMSIYETVAAQSNRFRASAPAIVPWKFWDVCSARNPKDYFIALGGDYKALEAEGAVYAAHVMERYNLIARGAYPVKHDPVFDALVEAFCIKSIESKLKI